jgi:hypothetical protein
MKEKDLLVELFFDAISHLDLVVRRDSREGKVYVGVRISVHLGDVHVQT